MALRLNVTVRLGRAERREKTRQDLIAAAARVFAAKGFAGASVDDVAEAAGYTKGAVYSNFASKTDLMIALIEDRVRRGAAALADAFDGASLQEGLRACEDGEPGVTGFDRDWMVLMAEFMLYAMRDERARVAMAAEYERARSISAAMLAAKYAESGLEPPLPPRDLAILVESLGVGLGFQVLIDPEGVSLDIQEVAVERLLEPRAPAATQPPAAPAAPQPPMAPTRPAGPGGPESTAQPSRRP